MSDERPDESDICRCGWLSCRECFPKLNADPVRARLVIEEINR